MNEQENKRILHELGLSEAEVRDLLQRLNDFFNTLNERQKHAILKAQGSIENGLSKDITPQRLQTFLQEFAPPGGIICILCDEDFRHKPK